FVLYFVFQAEDGIRDRTVTGVQTCALPIYTDESWARAKGFRAPLAQGMMSTAYVSEMMTRFLGAGFVKGGTISMAFVKPVYAGDRLTVHGVVKDRQPENGGTRVTVEVWCVNQDGQTTAIGTASGLEP